MFKNKLRKSVFALSLLAGSLFSSAQTHDVSLNLAPIAFSNFSGNYSLNFNDNMSTGIVVGFQNLKITSTNVNGGSESIKYGGFYFAPEFKYYFNPDNGNDGYFAGGYLKFRRMGTSGNAYEGVDVDGNIKTYDETKTGVSFGVLTGRTWVTNFGLFFSTWGGLGYYLVDKTSYSNNFKPDPTTVVENNLPSLDLRVGLSVGYRIGM